MGKKEAEQKEEREKQKRARVLRFTSSEESILGEFRFLIFHILPCTGLIKLPRMMLFTRGPS